MSLINKGKLIVIEGLDGSGKATQAEKLYNRVKCVNNNCIKLSFPDYGNPSSSLVRMYLNGEIAESPEMVNAYAASSFYAVDRYASYMMFWKKDYENGMNFISDRYTTANAIYQTVKVPKRNWDSFLEWLMDYEYEKLGVPRPNIVLYLDMPTEISQRLMTSRYGGDESKKDIHEKNVGFLKHCREAALYAAKKLGWKIIQCSENGEPLSIDEIHEKIFNCILQNGIDLAESLT